MGVEPAPNAIFKRGVGLADNWEANLEALIAKDVTPNLGKVLLRQHESLSLSARRLCVLKPCVTDCTCCDVVQSG